MAALDRIEAECRRLAEAIGRGGPLEALVDRLQACQGERDVLRGQLAKHRAHTPPGSPVALERRLRAKLAEWHELLTADIETGRQVLRLLVADPFRFAPVLEAHRRGYQFRGTLALDQVVAGVIELPAPPVSGAATSRQYTGVASLMPASWNQIASWLQRIDGLWHAA